jgi:VanZ family protein
LRDAASRLLPPLLLMVVIYWLSDQPSLSSGLGAWDTVLRKIAHLVEYGLLWLLWWRATRYDRPLSAVVITLLYAASDELHQTMVEGRSGSPVDWAIDAAGVGLAGMAVVVRHRLRSARTTAARRHTRGRRADERA